jgi:hypothetical protein
MVGDYLIDIKLYNRVVTFLVLTPALYQPPQNRTTRSLTMAAHILFSGKICGSNKCTPRCPAKSVPQSDAPSLAMREICGGKRCAPLLQAVRSGPPIFLLYFAHALAAFGASSRPSTPP